MRAALRTCLLLWLLATQLSAQEATLEGRARAQTYPLSIALPEGWKSFPADSKVRGEILFLQSPTEGSLDATVRLSAFPMPKSWESILRRETYHLVVELDAPVLLNEALTLRGAKGHKWFYRADSSKGESQVHYRLYLALPASVGVNRLLVLHASAPAEQSTEALSLFNSLARSLTWGPSS